MLAQTTVFLEQRFPTPHEILLELSLRENEHVVEAVAFERSHSAFNEVVVRYLCERFAELRERVRARHFRTIVVILLVPCPGLLG